MHDISAVTNNETLDKIYKMYNKIARMRQKYVSLYLVIAAVVYF